MGMRTVALTCDVIEQKPGRSNVSIKNVSSHMEASAWSEQERR